ncbi:NAD-dependent epimerase/dehydratase family protein [Albibacterium indicum]|uniref:NAD-dependent epimerase/dehydratase family protein n=1 Tax=Albibacterium indicum TaxID=2292082 RepID=UPI000E53E766|nr:NAD-dependent epimerase/dehydratase family protein [Pedobacter indicus]
MEKTKILFTGSNGFLGKILKSAFSTEFEIKDLQEFSKEYIDISKNITLNIDFLPEIIIHSAGKAHSVPKSKWEQQRFFDVNYWGTVNLTSFLDKLEVRPSSFIFMSTVSVYGLESGENVNEKHALLGDSPYAKSKIMAEEYLKKWASLNNITLSILRLPLVAGPNPPGNLGAMINGINTGRYFSIGKANSKKSVIWAEDIVKIIPRLSEVGGIFNLTDGYNPSFGELERAISESLDRPLPTKIPMLLARVLAKIGDLLGPRSPISSDKLRKITSSLTFDDSKARKEIGWRPSNVLEKIKTDINI